MVSLAAVLEDLKRDKAGGSRAPTVVHARACLTRAYPVSREKHG